MLPHLPWGSSDHGGHRFCSIPAWAVSPGLGRSAFWFSQPRYLLVAAWRPYPQSGSPPGLALLQPLMARLSPQTLRPPSVTQGPPSQVSGVPWSLRLAAASGGKQGTCRLCRHNWVQVPHPPEPQPPHCGMGMTRRAERARCNRRSAQLRKI